MMITGHGLGTIPGGAHTAVLGTIVPGDSLSTIPGSTIPGSMIPGITILGI